MLQDLLPKLSDEQIVSFVSNQNWVAFPIPGEETKDDVENRPDAHIDLRLLRNTLRIGLRCNTVPSVDKLKNVLHDFHAQEKIALTESMQKLDSDFQTAVYAKIKEHNRAERAEYKTRFQTQTNQLDRAGVEEMFRWSGQIREEGKRRMKEGDLPHNPVTPVIDLAFTTIDRNENQLYLSKLAQLKPIFETCLKVKTDSSIRAALRNNAAKKSKVISRSAQFTCSKCGKKFSREDAKQKKFCDVDGMKIQTVFVYN